jgi:hypothetical protein
MTNPYRRLEPALAPLVGVAVLIGAPGPHSLTVGRVCVLAGLLTLLQSLVRDLYVLATRRAAPRDGARQGWFLCVESALGLALVLQGLFLGYTGATAVVSLGAVVWAVAAALWWLVGYAVREVVFEVRRDPNHMNLLIGPPARS